MKLITSGESHGKGLLAILEGIPAGIPVNISLIKQELNRRRYGYGRGPRMSIEKDEFEIVSGIYQGETNGAPLGVFLKNSEYDKWKNLFKESRKDNEKLFPKTARPGHADYAGAMKYGFDNFRPVLERASARSTASIVAAGAVGKTFLKELGIYVHSVVSGIGGKNARNPGLLSKDDFEKVENRLLRTYFKDDDDEFRKIIDKAEEKGTTLGGRVNIFSYGVPPGLGSYVSYSERIDFKISGCMMSIPSVKAVEIGRGIRSSKKEGAEVLDEFTLVEDKVKRKSNYAGGIEGGVTNGEPVFVRLFVKPIPTQKKKLKSFRLDSMEETTSFYERSDICVVPSVGVIGEHWLNLILMELICRKFGGDNMEDLTKSYKSYLERIPWEPSYELQL